MRRTDEEIAEDYKNFRGNCQSLCAAAIKEDPTLTIVRGHYFCMIWATEEPHWWCVRPDGTIVDPSARQFPDNGAGWYTPFNGRVECSQCGKEMDESEASFESNYCFCSGACHGRFVGVY